MNFDDFIDYFCNICRHQDIYMYIISKKQSNLIIKIDVDLLQIKFWLTNDRIIFVEFLTNNSTNYCFLSLYKYTDINLLKMAFPNYPDIFWYNIDLLIYKKDIIFDRGWKYNRNFFKNQEECSICLSNLNDNFTQKIVVKELLSCHHLFHQKCIDKWSEHNLHTSFFIACPTCRSLSKNTCLDKPSLIPKPLFINL